MKVVQLLPSQSLVESGADFSAVQPKFDVVYLIDHGVLGAFQSAIGNQSTGKQEAHSDGCEDNTDDVKYSLGRGNTRECLREIDGPDGPIQR